MVKIHKAEIKVLDIYIYNMMQHRKHLKHPDSWLLVVKPGCWLLVPVARRLSPWGATVKAESSVENSEKVQLKIGKMSLNIIE